MIICVLLSFLYYLTPLSSVLEKASGPPCLPQPLAAKRGRGTASAVEGACTSSEETPSVSLAVDSSLREGAKARAFFQIPSDGARVCTAASLSRLRRNEGGGPLQRWRELVHRRRRLPQSALRLTAPSGRELKRYASKKSGDSIQLSPDFKTFIPFREEAAAITCGCPASQ